MPLDLRASIRWLEPWGEIVPEDERAQLESELQRELAPSHLLYGEPARAIGRRQDCDDVLFCLLSNAVAVVHLTYVRPAPDLRPWPDSECFPDLATSLAERMPRDHEEFAN